MTNTISFAYPYSLLICEDREISFLAYLRLSYDADLHRDSGLGNLR